MYIYYLAIEVQVLANFFYSNQNRTGNSISGCVLVQIICKLISGGKILLVEVQVTLAIGSSHLWVRV